MAKQSKLFDFSFKVEHTYPRYQISLFCISLGLGSFALEQNKMWCYRIKFYNNIYSNIHSNNIYIAILQLSSIPSLSSLASVLMSFWIVSPVINPNLFHKILKPRISVLLSSQIRRNRGEKWILISLIIQEAWCIGFSEWNVILMYS